MNETLSTIADWAQIIGIPLAIILAIWSYKRSQQKRELTCIFDEITSPIVIKAGDALKGDIELRYRGQPIKNLFVIRITVRNTGNLEISKANILEPITFSFPQTVELVKRPIIVEAYPESLRVNWSFDRSLETSKVHMATMDFDLLNSDEELTVEFVCTGEEPSEPQVMARIKGLSIIKSRYRKDMLEAYKQYKNDMSKYGILLVLLSLIFICRLGSWVENPNTTLFPEFTKYVYLVGLVLMLTLGVLIIAVGIWMRRFIERNS